MAEELETLELSLTALHGPGQASIAYINLAPATEQDDTPRLKVITCGADGRACVHETTEAGLGSVVGTFKSTDGPLNVLAVDAACKAAVVGSDQYAKIMSAASLGGVRDAGRMNLPLRAMAFNTDGSQLAIAGDMQDLKLIDIKEGPVLPVKRILSYPDGYIRHMAFSPDSQCLAAMDSDGTLLVWGLNDFKPKLSPRKGAGPKLDRTSLGRNGLAWHPDGSLLAIASKNYDVEFFDTLSWKVDGYLCEKGHKDVVNLVAYSPNGVYILTAGNDKQLCVWEAKSASVIARASCAAIISSAVWHPTSNEIAIITEGGEAGLWVNPVPATFNEPWLSVEELEKKDLARLAEENPGAQISVGADQDDTAGNDDEDPEENSFIDNDDAEQEEPGQRQRGRGEGRSGGGRGRDRMPPPAGRAKVYNVTQVLARDPPPQPAIQPGCTPLQEGRARFLAYNQLGMVVSRAVDDRHVVEVTFHNTQTHSHRMPALTDYYGFTRAALCDKGVFYSSPPAPEDFKAGIEALPSMLAFRAFGAWAEHSDWQAPLPAGEDAECVAAGATFVAAATSTHTLRLFSLGGDQSAVVSLGGAPVALAAQAHTLAVVYHGSEPNTVSRAQGLNFMLMDVSSRCVLGQGFLPITPGSTLTWLSFTEEGLLATADSAGVVRVRGPEFGGSWVPVFDSTCIRDKGEDVWPVGLSSTHLTSITCSADQPYPQVSPPPYFTMHPLHIPVLAVDGGSADSELESMALLQSLALAQARASSEGASQDADLDAAVHAQMKRSDAAILKLYQANIKAGRYARCLDLAAQLSMLQCLEGALKLANAHRAGPLAERLKGFLEQRMAMEEEAAAAAEAQAWQHVGRAGPSNAAGLLEADEDANGHDNEMDDVHGQVDNGGTDTQERQAAAAADSYDQERRVDDSVLRIRSAPAAVNGRPTHGSAKAGSGTDNGRAAPLKSLGKGAVLSEGAQQLQKGAKGGKVRGNAAGAQQTAALKRKAPAAPAAPANNPFARNTKSKV